MKVHIYRLQINFTIGTHYQYHNKMLSIV